MEIKSISDSLTVAPQITAADIPDPPAAGYRANVCNRPEKVLTC